MTLPEMFERACKSRDSFSDVGGRYLTHGDGSWWLETDRRSERISGALAETLIVGACVALLVDEAPWCLSKRGDLYNAMRLNLSHPNMGKRLAESLLSAVIATTQGEGEKR